jgi:hypothetical protein
VRASCHRHRAHRVLTIVLLGLAALAGGCGDKAIQTSSGGPVLARPPERSGTKQIPVSNTDPCATRLHDLCAPLLLYYGENHSLPARLEDLRQVTGFADDVVLTCPTTNRPYVYNPVGVVNPNQAERVIIYDAEPHSGGIRWAISIIEPKGNEALITKVIGLQESQFHFSLPSR